MGATTLTSGRKWNGTFFAKARRKVHGGGACYKQKTLDENGTDFLYFFGESPTILLLSIITSRQEPDGTDVIHEEEVSIYLSSTVRADQHH